VAEEACSRGAGSRGLQPSVHGVLNWAPSTVMMIYCNVRSYFDCRPALVLSGKAVSEGFASTSAILAHTIRAALIYLCFTCSIVIPFLMCRVATRPVLSRPM